MASKRISKRTVDACQPGEKQALLWDSDLTGFGLRVMPSGVKTYVYQYRMGGRGSPTRRYTIGRHGALTAEQAREVAEGLSLSVAKGIDPIEEERAIDEAKQRAKADAVAKAVRDRELAFSAYAETFLDKGLKSATRDRTKQGYRGAITNHIAPVLGDTPVTAIRATDLHRVLDRIPAGQPAVRRIVFAVMRMLFRWAVEREDIASNPTDSMKAPEAPESRDRTLLDGELALALRAAAEMAKPFGPYFELLFATAQRRDEVAGLNWSELDRVRAEWTLPGNRSKNGEANIVPLNATAMAVLDRLAGQEGAAEPAWPKRGLVFTTNGEAPISGYSRAKTRLDAAMLKLARKDAETAGEDPDEVTLDPWRLHDARRTVATALQRLGIRFEVTEAVLNHVSGASRSGVAGVYQRYGWGPEKRTALEAWDAHCRALVSPAESTSNVVQLPAAAAQ